MKRYLMLFAVVIAALPLFADDALLGRWEGVARNKSLAESFEFRAHGEVFMSAVVALDAKYVREGSHVKIMTGDTSTATFDFEASGDTLTRKSNGETGKLTRVGPAVPNDPLAGTWKYEYRLGGPAYETFGTDGSFRFRYLLTKGATTGRYKQEGENITIRFPDGRVIKITAVVKDDTLMLTDAGRVSQLIRASY